MHSTLDPGSLHGVAKSRTSYPCLPQKLNIKLCVATCEAVWLRRLLLDVGEENKVATMIKCDNQSSIKLANSLYFIRTQSISIHNFILLGRKFSQKKSILSIVIVVAMLLIFLPNLLVESHLSCLGKC